MTVGIAAMAEAAMMRFSGVVVAPVIPALLSVQGSTGWPAGQVSEFQVWTS